MPTATNPIPRPAAGVMGVVDEITFHMRLVITTAGAVDTTNSWLPGGVTLIKTAATAGRYTITLPTAFERLLQVDVCPIGPDTAVYGANTTGYDAFIRRDNVTRTVNLAASTQTGDFKLQFTQTSYADAEVPDGLSYMITVKVARGKTF